MRVLRRNPIIWAVLLAPGAFILGYIGYRDPSVGTMSRSDALFSSLQLFALEGSVNPRGTPWPLNVARFLAPLTVLYASVVAVLAILRDHVQSAAVALFARDHVVVVGLGRSGAVLADSMRRAGQQVVAVEADASNERISAVRAFGVRVIVGDATQRIILQRARVARAAHVIIATGEDALNLEIGEHARSLVVDQPSRRTTIHVDVAEQDLWMELGRLHLESIETGVVLEFYNRIDRAAQTLLTEAERFNGLDAFRKVTIEGDGALAQRLLVHLVRRAVMSEVRPEIFMSPESAEAVVEPLRAREPWIFLAANLTFARHSTADSSGAVAFVCLSGPDSSAIARGLALSSSPGRRAVLVAVQGQQTDALLASTRAGKVVHLTSVNLRALGAEFLRHSGHELMARVRHEDYVANERAKGSTPDQNPSLVGWDELPEPLKESNRRFAESVGDVIHGLGGKLVPLRDLAGQQTLFEPGDVLELLARNEHDRWMAALVSDGWRYSPAAKDPDRKTHPLLVPWADLPEAEKEKDRDAIRAIPRMLARVGFGLDLPSGRNEPTGMRVSRRTD